MSKPRMRKLNPKVIRDRIQATRRRLVETHVKLLEIPMNIDGTSRLILMDALERADQAMGTAISAVETSMPTVDLRGSS